MALDLQIRDEVPTPVKVLGFLFLLGAIGAVIHILIGALFQMRLNLDFGVLGFWIGPGLTRGDRAWWGFAQVIIWIGVIVIPAGTAVILMSEGQATWSIFDIPIGFARTSALIPAAVLAEALQLWSLWVLHKYHWFTERALAS